MNSTVGEQLRSAREKMGYSLSDVVKATHIRLRYLQELEDDHPELLNSPVQARGFLRLYAEFLNLPFPELLEQWPQDMGGGPADAAPDQDHINGAVVQKDGRVEPEFDHPPDGGLDQPGQKSGAGERPAGSALKRISTWLAKVPAVVGRKKHAADKTDLPQEISPQEPGDGQDEVSEPAQVPAQTSNEIFNEIGCVLRERRIALELTLSDAERFTSVKRMYLDAMETGRFDELPSTVQGRGMLNNYSQFLALDDTALMDTYARALQAQRTERVKGSKRPIQPPLTVQLNIPEKWRRILNPDLIIGGLIIVAIFGFILWGSAQIFRGGDPAQTDAPSISEVLQQTPSTTPVLDGGTGQDGSALAAESTPIPGVVVLEATPTQIATVNAAPLQLYIISHDRAYLRIIVDGVNAFDGRVQPENVYTYSGQSSIELLTGNGAALEVYFNQDYLGDLGGVGEVVRMQFSEEGFSTPVPQATPTPLADQPDTILMEDL